MKEGRLVFEGGLTFFWIDFSADGKRLAVGGRNGEILILDVGSGDTLVSIPNAHGGKN
ncbi:hypothetical protein ACFL3Q_04335 [Planctomycetota bacterium]